LLLPWWLREDASTSLVVFLVLTFVVDVW
jgi:hypothetical protein